MPRQETPSFRFRGILQTVGRYYSSKVKTHGPTAKGVDWNSPESQRLRFDQLLKVCDATVPFCINDYGCGYGALVEYLTAKGCTFRYRGYDISAEMIGKARQLFGGLQHCEFFTDESLLPAGDYTVASGIFNVKLSISEEKWKGYVLYTLKKIERLSERGFAFNLLTKYSDPERIRPHLYYADPLFMFDYCKRNFSKYVSLLHDYPLYEFTILVRK